MSTTMTIRIDEKTKKKLDNLSKATERTKSFIIGNAIKDFLELNEWQVQAIKNTIKKADKPDAKFIGHEEVVQWLDSWGKKDELEPPK
ncbi:MAG: hypothetical protein A2X59_03330 [Nitrospirae bacterium GWC2_42_7]|nr:MAG: hypothetical protein A2X59_03330 [Nitrospirae bacterium GWC2_42_7]